MTWHSFHLVMLMLCTTMHLLRPPLSPMSDSFHLWIPLWQNIASHILTSTLWKSLLIYLAPFSSNLVDTYDFLTNCAIRMRANQKGKNALLCCATVCPSPSSARDLHLERSPSVTLPENSVRRAACKQKPRRATLKKMPWRCAEPQPCALPHPAQRRDWSTFIVYSGLRRPAHVNVTLIQTKNLFLKLADTTIAVLLLTPLQIAHSFFSVLSFQEFCFLKFSVHIILRVESFFWQRFCQIFTFEIKKE